MEPFLILLLFLFLGAGLFLFVPLLFLLQGIRNSQEKNEAKLSLILKLVEDKEKQFSITEKKELETHIVADTHPSPTAQSHTSHLDPISHGMASQFSSVLNEKTEIETKTLKIPQKTVPPQYEIPPQSDFEKIAREIFSRIWNWIAVGEEYKNKNLSLEYAIATVWLIRVSILIFVSGIAFFLKYSIDNNLAGPLGRVSIATLTGLFMIAFGVRIARKKYRLIAQGLLGGGIIILYFSVFASFAIYKLLPFSPSFVIMILITILASGLSLKFDSLLVAIFAVVGAYATPIMINTGRMDFTNLFSYLLLVGGGALWMARYRDWKLLNALSLMLTYFLFFFFTEKHYNHVSDFNVTMLFLSLFFLLHSVVPLMDILLKRSATNLLTLIGMTTNALFFFIAAYNFIDALYGRRYCAIPSLSLAGFYSVQFALLRLRCQEEKNMTRMLLAFASFFISISAPILLSGKWITASWAIEAAILMRLGGSLKTSLLRDIARIVFIVAVSRFVLFDFAAQFERKSPEFYFSTLLDRAVPFLSLAFSALANYLSSLKSEKTIKDAMFFGILSILLFFVYTSLELNNLLHLTAPTFKAGGISILWGIYALTFVITGISWKIKKMRYCGLALFAIVALKIFLVDLISLSQLYRIIAFLALGIVILGGAFVYIKFEDFFRILDKRKP